MRWQCFRPPQVNERFGLSLLHKHFGLSEEEIIVRKVNVKRRIVDKEPEHRNSVPMEGSSRGSNSVAILSARVSRKSSKEEANLKDNGQASSILL